jgi:GrpB-like predicted nucleotidyltransferase (UPF0157 family)
MLVVVTVVVVPYDPKWPRRFEKERELLDRILRPWLLGGIHHIGSTSVPGLAAKPIIDMLAGVRDLEGARAASSVLVEHSYEDAPHRPDVAHHFAKVVDGVTTFGLHLTEPGSELWRERLAFRNALRADHGLASEYESLKRRLAQEHNAGQLEYTPGKRPFVAHVLAREGIELQPR